MLKEIVTSIFCCLPHHHEAPVVAERITPITIVSQEPYSREAYYQAVEEKRFDDAFSIAVKQIIELGGQRYIEVMDEYCEQFAKEKRYLTEKPDNEAWKENPVFNGRVAFNFFGISRCCQHTPLVKHALATEDRGYTIKALFWVCVETDRREWEYGKLLDIARGYTYGR